jgi:hypothetical protein
MPVNGVMTLPPSMEGVSIPSAMPPFSVADIRKRTNAIQEILRGVMKEGTHYGTIPGTPKPSLWKAGAEVIAMTFRLAPMLKSRVTVDDLDADWSYIGTKRDGTVVTGTCIGFFEVESACTIHGPTGEVLSRCSARCNNRETKYRGLSVFEIRNTILKMSEKRAFVSAVLMATGASDIFTQDLEDFPELLDVRPAKSSPEAKKVQNPEEPAPATLPEPNEPYPGCGSQTGQRLTPKREAWLLRVAQEGQIAQDAVQRCTEFLRGAGPQKVKAFFDEMARRKDAVFAPFLTAS